MGDLSSHFDSSEFADPTTGEATVNQRLVDLLENLRNVVQKPIHVTSGYRSPSHNQAVGGAKDSQHCLGNAADITWDGIVMPQAKAWAEQVGFTGIGVYADGHLHVDVRPGQRVEWNG
jgi:zinc D-Ala-D-Ala carboxypeptidase